MAKRIYVGSLPYKTTAENLGDLFATYGTVVDSMIIMDRMTGQSKGFGFIEMQSEDEADAAITALNGSSFGGRTLVVNLARDREERGAGSGDRLGSGGGDRFGDSDRGGGRDRRGQGARW